jgi:hypothetical protein
MPVAEATKAMRPILLQCPPQRRSHARSAPPTVAALAVALLTLVAACSPGAASAPTLADPAAEAQARANAFFAAVQSGDAAQVDAVLAPAVRIARANGTVMGRDEYLKELPSVKSFSIDGVNAVQSGDTLVATYTVHTDQVANGRQQPIAAAPRLSVFQWLDGEWRLLAHANFNAINK